MVSCHCLHIQYILLLARDLSVSFLMAWTLPQAHAYLIASKGTKTVDLDCELIPFQGI